MLWLGGTMIKNLVVCCGLALAGLGCTNSMQNASESSEISGTAVMNIGNSDGVLAKEALGQGLTGVENVWLTIKQVDIHTSGNGWVTVAQPNARFDFLQLVNGLTTPLTLYPLPAGHYTQIRLILAEDGDAVANEIVVNGQTFPIRIPSGIQTGIKCVHQFTINPNQETEICLQFDILKAIKFAAGTGYSMRPTYKTVLCKGQPYDPSNPDEVPR
jgi:hypothetical protein